MQYTSYLQFETKVSAKLICYTSVFSVIGYLTYY